MAVKKFVARSPEDVVAVVPLVLGFHPAESLVLLGLRGSRQMHLRVDHPHDEADRREVAALAVEAMTRNGVTGCVMVSYVTGSAAAALATGMRESFLSVAEAAGLAVIDHIWVERDRWRQADAEGGFTPAAGVPFEVSSHPMLAEAVTHGLAVPASSREVMAASLVGEADPVAAVVESRERLAALVEPGALVAEGRWLQERVREFVADGRRLSVSDAARFFAAVERIELRDVVWSEIRPESAARLVDLLADLVRRTPGKVAPVAGLLGFAAWQAGQGALAWCAVDRAVAEDPGYPLAGLLATVLQAAVAPGEWEHPEESAMDALVEAAAAAG